MNDNEPKDNKPNDLGRCMPTEYQGLQFQVSRQTSLFLSLLNHGVDSVLALVHPDELSRHE